MQLRLICSRLQQVSGEERAAGHVASTGCKAAKARQSLSKSHGGSPCWSTWRWSMIAAPTRRDQHVIKITAMRVDGERERERREREQWWRRGHRVV